MNTPRPPGLKRLAVNLNARGGHLEDRKAMRGQGLEVPRIGALYEVLLRIAGNPMKIKEDEASTCHDL